MDNYGQSELLSYKQYIPISIFRRFQLKWMDIQLPVHEVDNQIHVVLAVVNIHNPEPAIIEMQHPSIEVPK